MDSKKVVAITACTAGVAHTYIAEENLIKWAKKLNHKIRVETQGTIGKENELTLKEIKEADLVVIATDVKIDLSRFVGKLVYQTNVKKAVHEPKKLLENALKKSKIYKSSNSSNSNNETSKGNIGFMRHILTGVSWMIPAAIAASILIAIPGISALFAGHGKIAGSYNWDKEMVPLGLTNGYWKLMWLMINMGWTSIALMLPVFAGFAAYSIGDKPAFVPGFIGGIFANPKLLFFASDGKIASVNKIFGADVYPYVLYSSGFWGALLIAFIAGFSIKLMVKYIRPPKLIRSIMPMLVLPGLGVIIVVTTMLYVVNPIFGLLNYHITNGLKSNHQMGAYIYALVIGPLTAMDLGGPFNKAAGVVAMAFYNDHLISFTGRVIPTITPSMGMGIAVFIDKALTRRRVFDTSLKKSGPNSFILALFGISEGGLPFLFKNPIITVTINVIGGTVGSVVGTAFGTEQWFPDSSIYAWPFASPIWGLLLALFISVALIAVLHVYVRFFLIKFKYIKEPEIIETPSIDWKNIFKKKVRK